MKKHYIDGFKSPCCKAPIWIRSKLQYICSECDKDHTMAVIYWFKAKFEE